MLSPAQMHHRLKKTQKMPATSSDDQPGFRERQGIRLIVSLWKLGRHFQWL
jgi:hypothetical protein